MPTAMMKQVVDLCGISQNEFESKWDKAKTIVTEQYNLTKDKDPRFYELAVGILKKMLGEQCVAKLGWKNKAEQLQSILEADNTWDIYEVMSEEPDLAFILTDSAAALKDAWLNKDVSFFSALLKPHLEHSSMYGIPAYKADVKRRIIEVMLLAGMDVSTQRIETLDSIISEVFELHKRSMASQYVIG